ncbi:hypothetical protein DRQ32_00745, partial [bacterium]
DPADDSAATPASASAKGKPLHLIWAAFLMANLFYAVIGWFMARGERTVLNQEILNWMQIFLGMGSGLIILTVFLLRQLIAALSRHSYRIYCTIRWSLLELIAVFGLIQFILGGHFEVLLLFVAVAALAIGAARPGPSDRAVYLHQFE